MSHPTMMYDKQGRIQDLVKGASDKLPPTLSNCYCCLTSPFSVTRKSMIKIFARGGVLPSKRLLGMCRWMGSHFHNWTDYNGVTFLACFSRVTRMGLEIFWIFGIRKFW